MRAHGALLDADHACHAPAHAYGSDVNDLQILVLQVSEGFCAGFVTCRYRTRMCEYGDDCRREVSLLAMHTGAKLLRSTNKAFHSNKL
jgi:hypothetical protein